MAWWGWVVAGGVLALLELLAPGYIFLGFAFGAVATGLLVLVFGTFAGLPVMLVVFALLSVAAWALLRRSAGVWRGQVKRWDRDINDN